MKAKAHIDSLAEQMRRGLWLSKTQIDFARVGSQLVLVNGHHRMHAQAAAGIDIVWSVVIHECASQEEVAQLYWKFDTTLRKRTRANIVNGIGLAGELGISSQVAASLWSCAQTIALGMRFHVHMRDGAGILPDERLMVCRDYAQEARFYQDATKKAIPPVRRKMMQASLMAVALVTLKHQPSKAQEFWVGFCEDDGLAKGDPRKTLLADIQTRHATAGLSSAQMMAAARAWSAFYHGRDLKIIKVTGCPVDIAGTPFTVRA